MNTYKHKNIVKLTKTESVQTNTNNEVLKLQNQVRELMSDYERLQNISEKKIKTAGEEKKKETILNMLPIIDTLICASKEYEFGSVMLKQALNILKDMGVEPIQTIGKTYDYRFHKAVSHIEDDSNREMVIVEEFQKGFLYGDEVLRYSLVEVVN